VIAALVPGQAKTPVFKVALRPVRTLEAKRIADHDSVAQAAGLASKLVEKQERELLNEAGPEADPETLAGKLEDFVAKLGQTLDPGPPPRLLTEDVTPEGLAGLIGDHGRIMVASDEGSAMFENLAGRYARGSSSWDLFNKAHAAADLAVDRKGSPPIIIFDPALTLAITTQPAMLRALAAKPEPGERGVLARPLYAVPAPVFAETPTPAAPKPVLDEYARRMRNLYEDVPGLEHDEDGHPRPQKLDFADDALAPFERWERDVKAELRDLSADEENAGLSLGWLSKLAGQTARLAAVLHAAEHWSAGSGTVLQTISLSTVECAITLSRYYQQHAQAAFGLMGQLPAQRRAVAILRWLTTRTAEELDGLTVRDVHRTRGKGTKAEDVRAAIGVLEEHGYLRVERRVPGEKGGRPSELIHVHPSLLNSHDKPDKPDKTLSGGAFRRVCQVDPMELAGDEAAERRAPQWCEEGYLACLDDLHRNGHVTTGEALRLERLHVLIQKAHAAAERRQEGTTR
jgi:replicative DNA helicase